MRTDGQPDEQRETMKPAVAFRNFGNAPKNPTREGFGTVLFKTRHEDGRVQDRDQYRTSELFIQGYLLL